MSSTKDENGATPRHVITELQSPEDSREVPQASREGKTKSLVKDLELG